MPEPNATPAPLTKKRNRFVQADIDFEGWAASEYGRSVIDTDDEGGFDRHGFTGTAFHLTSIDGARYTCNAMNDLNDALAATRAKLAEAEAQHEACPACGEAYLRPGELQVQIDALREVSACRAALEEVGYTGSLPVGVYEKLADERAELSTKLTAAESRVAALTEALERIAEMGGERGRARALAQAALSPSQDAKEARDA